MTNSPHSAQQVKIKTEFMDYFFLRKTSVARANRKNTWAKTKLQLAVKENCKENLEQSKRKSNKLLDKKNCSEVYFAFKHTIRNFKHTFKDRSKLKYVFMFHEQNV